MAFKFREVSFTIIISIVSVFIGYISNSSKNETVFSDNKIHHAMIDDNSISIVSDKLDNISKKLDNISNELEITSEKLMLFSSSLQKKDTLSSVSKIPDSQNVSENETDTKHVSNEINRIKNVIDYDRLQESIENINSGDVFLREKAIRTMIAIGSPEIKYQIEDIMVSSYEDIQVRQAAIETFEWSGSGEFMEDIFQNDENPQVLESIIYAALKTHFDEDEREKINQLFYSSFYEQNDDSVKIAILDYFANMQTEQFEQLIGSISQDSVSSEVQNHIAFLKKGIIDNDNT